MAALNLASVSRLTVSNLPISRRKSYHVVDSGQTRNQCLD
jgi:hypothetical protein